MLFAPSQHFQHLEHLQPEQEHFDDYHFDHLDLDHIDSLSQFGLNSLALSPSGFSSAGLSPVFLASRSPSPCSPSPVFPLATASSPLPDEQDPVLAAAFDAGLLGRDCEFSMLAGGDLTMSHGSEPWLQNSQHNSQQSQQNQQNQQNSQLAGRPLARFSHHRESSLSSLGSAGPASPFSQNTSNPHIAVTDHAGDTYPGMPYYDDGVFSLAKPSVSSVSGAPTSAAASQDVFYGASHGVFAPHDALPGQVGMFHSLPVVATRRQKPAALGSERGFLPPPDMSLGTNASRSQPVSVASSIASNSPATPLLDHADEDVRRRHGNVAFPPKLERTITDMCNDELYSPAFTAAAPSPALAAPAAHGSAPAHDLYQQRIHTINNQHLSGAVAAARHSPVMGSVGREGSPFRNSSPLSSVPVSDFGAAGNLRYTPYPQSHKQAQSQPHQHQHQHQHQHRHRVGDGSEGVAPQTISPKDAVYDYHASPSDSDTAHLSLFAQNNTPTYVGQMGKPSTPQTQITGGYGNNYSFIAPLAANIPVTQQYPFVAQQQSAQTLGGAPIGGPVSTITTSAQHSSPFNPTSTVQRPAGVTADGGTYTCTYHGCRLRFETPALLQKHKREGHRQANALIGARRADGALVPGVESTQAGPHRCERINPSTGKPCNTIFSRPYDLTRHEDTIHNARKQKVRCALCTEEKTFSRADALTRHFRVCHPDVELKGKHRKRVTHPV